MNILSPCVLFTVVTSLVREGLVVAEGRTLTNFWDLLPLRGWVSVHFKKKIYLFIGVRKRTRGRTEGENLKPTPHCAWCRAQRGARPHGHKNMTWTETKSRTLGWLSHSGAPYQRTVWIKVISESLFVKVNVNLCLFTHIFSEDVYCHLCCFYQHVYCFWTVLILIET